MVRYLLGSFGDFQRIDYGSGHELNFVCFMYAVVSMDAPHLRINTANRVAPIPAESTIVVPGISPTLLTTPSTELQIRSLVSTSQATPINNSALSRDTLEKAALVSIVFSTYVHLCRRLQRMYFLEVVIHIIVIHFVFIYGTLFYKVRINNVFSLFFLFSVLVVVELGVLMVCVFLD